MQPSFITCTYVAEAGVSVFKRITLVMLLQLVVAHDSPAHDVSFSHLSKCSIREHYITWRECARCDVRSPETEPAHRDALLRIR